MEACWAHNPEVRGSKPRSANYLFIFLFFLYCYGYYIVVYIKLELGNPRKILVRNGREFSLSTFLKQHRMIKTKPKCPKMFFGYNVTEQCYVAISYTTSSHCTVMTDCVQWLSQSDHSISVLIEFY